MALTKNQNSVAPTSSLRPLRVFYFFTGVSGGLFLPYLSLWLRHDGFTASTVGLLMSSGILVSIFAQPMWGIIVDKHPVIRLVLALTTAIPAIVSPLFSSHFIIIVGLLTITFNVFTAPQAPLADSLAMNTIHNTHHTYSSIRLFGSLGFALGSLAAGQYLMRFPMSSLWIPFFIIGLINAGVSFRLPRGTHSPLGPTQFNRGMRTILHNRPFLLFLVGTFFLSLTLSAYNMFFPITFMAIGGNPAGAGTAMFVGSLSNVPSMLLGARLLKIMSPKRLMLIASLAYVIRWTLELLFPHPWVFVLAQILHGASFGFFYISAVTYVSQTFPPALKATGQSVFGMVNTGIASISCGIIDGYLLQVGGAHLLLLSSTISSVIGLGIFIVMSQTRKIPTGSFDNSL